jgi:hypothetical protein
MAYVQHHCWTYTVHSPPMGWWWWWSNMTGVKFRKVFNAEEVLSFFLKDKECRGAIFHRLPQCVGYVVRGFWDSLSVLSSHPTLGIPAIPTFSEPLPYVWEECGVASGMQELFHLFFSQTGPDLGRKWPGFWSPILVWDCEILHRIATNYKLNSFMARIYVTSLMIQSIPSRLAIIAVTW